MIEINRHIEILLLSNDCVIVPGFGGFMAHHVDARYDGRDNMFLPPLRTVGFNPQLTMNDSLLALSYVETYDISYPEALRRIEDEVVEIRQSLENEGKFEIENIGMLFLNEDGNISFEPCEAGILTPDFYGLGGFDILPIAQIDNGEQQNENPNVAMTVNLAKEEQPVKKEAEAPAAPANNSVFIAEEEEEKAEFISIKKSWLRNMAAACIALIAFFTISTPLGSPTIEKSQIDTGMLTRIMPKEIAPVKSNELLLPTDEPKLMETTPTDKAEKTPAMAQDREIATPTASYYSIVLASRVTKRNAASYVEYLQGKGFNEARVLITDNNVKVIYGNYRSESEAYNTLNRLHTNEAFTDGWITKVKE
ncbi:SPOR domain-containing protein [Segatella copri]|uniref:HU domain-containing protein n=1 Tax=Segatella copri TaxID=165179 RepID=UPI0033666C13